MVWSAVSKALKHVSRLSVNPLLVESFVPAAKIPIRTCEHGPSVPARRSLAVQMAILSRAFIRRRIISLTVAVSVAATSFALAQAPKGTPRTAARHAEEQQFLFANDPAISDMSHGMLVAPTGDIDRDFAAIMIPQHQGALDVARAELKYGHNEELRHLAQRIVSQQEQEISDMRRAIGETSAAAGQSSTVATASSMPSLTDRSVGACKVNAELASSKTIEHSETLFSGTTSSANYIQVEASAQ
jgi:hypothetical protein